MYFYFPLTHCVYTCEKLRLQCTLLMICENIHHFSEIFITCVTTANPSNCIEVDCPYTLIQEELFYLFSIVIKITQSQVHCKQTTPQTIKFLTSKFHIKSYSHKEYFIPFTCLPLIHDHQEHIFAIKNIVRFPLKEAIVLCKTNA